MIALCCNIPAVFDKYTSISQSLLVAATQLLYLLGHTRILTTRMVMNERAIILDIATLPLNRIITNEVLVNPYQNCTLTAQMSNIFGGYLSAKY